MKKVSIILATAMLLSLTSTTRAQSSDMIIKNIDFSNSESALIKVSDEEKIYIADDPLDENNEVLKIENGKDKIVQTDIEFLDGEKYFIESKIMREYENADNSYWDISFVLNDDEFNTVMAVLGQVIYQGNEYKNLSVFHMNNKQWYDCSIILEKSGDTIEQELYINNNYYGKVTQHIEGSPDKLVIKTRNSQGNGKVYLDDIVIGREPQELKEILKKIEEDSEYTGIVSEDTCKEWLEKLEKYTDTETIKNYFLKINKYAKAMKYIDEFSMNSLSPSKGEMISVNKTIKYGFSELLSSKENIKAEITDGEQKITPVVMVKGNMVILSAELQLDTQYTLKMENIKNELGEEYIFEPISFKTDFIPRINIESNGKYEMGHKLCWNDEDGIQTEVTLKKGEEIRNIQNGDCFPIYGDIEVCITSLKDGRESKEIIPINVIKNEAPIASGVKITGKAEVGETLAGQYEYNDADGDREDIEKTKLEWFISGEKDGEYSKKVGYGDKIVLTEDIIGGFLKFAVTPVSIKEPAVGTTAWSSEVTLPAAPVVSNVSIKGTPKVGNTLSGYYDYFDANSDPETSETVMEWIDGSGNVVGRGKVFEITSGMANKSVALRVVVKTNVFPKESNVGMSDYIKISASSSTSSSSSGSGGFGYIGSNSGSEDKGKNSGNIISTPEKNEEKVQGFDDIKGHWAQKYIIELKEQKIVNGVTENNFAPDSFVTRGQMITMIMRLFGEAQYQGQFEDVKSDDWFSNYVQKGLDMGVISQSNRFYPERNVTREEVAKFIGIFTDEAEGISNDFVDSGDISEWAREYVNKSSELGFFKGDDNGNFRPKDNMTRAEAAVLLWRIIDSGKAVNK